MLFGMILTGDGGGVGRRKGGFYKKEGGICIYVVWAAGVYGRWGSVCSDILPLCNWIADELQNVSLSGMK